MRQVTQNANIRVSQKLLVGGEYSNDLGILKEQNIGIFKFALIQE